MSRVAELEDEMEWFDECKAKAADTDSLNSFELCVGEYCLGNWVPSEDLERYLAAEEEASEPELPFGVDRPEALLEPFCACGRVVSRCDGSRRGCGKEK